MTESLIIANPQMTEKQNPQIERNHLLFTSLAILQLLWTTIPISLRKRMLTRLPPLACFSRLLLCFYVLPLARNKPTLEEEQETMSLSSIPGDNVVPAPSPISLVTNRVENFEVLLLHSSTSQKHAAECYVQKWISLVLSGQMGRCKQLMCVEKTQSWKQSQVKLINKHLLYKA